MTPGSLAPCKSAHSTVAAPQRGVLPSYAVTRLGASTEELEQRRPYEPEIITPSQRLSNAVRQRRFRERHRRNVTPSQETVTVTLRSPSIPLHPPLDIVTPSPETVTEKKLNESVAVTPSPVTTYTYLPGGERARRQRASNIEKKRTFVSALSVSALCQIAARASVPHVDLPHLAPHAISISLASPKARNLWSACYYTRCSPLQMKANARRSHTRTSLGQRDAAAHGLRAS